MEFAPISLIDSLPQRLELRLVMHLWTPVHDGNNIYVVLIAWQNGEISMESTSGVRMGLTSELEHVPIQ